MSPPPLAFRSWTRRDWLHRLATAAVMIVFLLGAYLGTQGFDVRPVHWLAPTAFDRAIPPDPRAVYLYVTFYPFLIVAGLFCDRSDFRRYVAALVATALVSSLVFVLVPTGVARGDIDAASAPALYRFIAANDLPRNALPSEHASFSILAGIVCWRAFRGRPVLRAAAGLWITLILWSTLATRQHVIADLLAGGFLGSLVWLSTASLKTENHLPSASGRPDRKFSEKPPKLARKSSRSDRPFNTE